MSDVVIPWTVAHQAPLSVEFFRQAYWSGLPFPSPGDLPDPGIEPGFLHYQEILYCLSHFDGFLPSTLGHVYLELGQRAIESESRKNFQHLELLLHQSNCFFEKELLPLFEADTVIPLSRAVSLAVFTLHCCLL